MGCCPWAEPGAGNEPCPNLHTPPPFFLLFFSPASRQEPVLPAAQSLFDMHTPAPSLPAFLSPAPSLPCLRQGTDISLPSFLLPCLGGGRTDARYMLYLLLFFPFLQSLAGPIGGACPVLIKRLRCVLGTSLYDRLGQDTPASRLLAAKMRRRGRFDKIHLESFSCKKSQVKTPK